MKRRRIEVRAWSFYVCEGMYPRLWWHVEFIHVHNNRPGIGTYMYMYVSDNYIHVHAHAASTCIYIHVTLKDTQNKLSELINNSLSTNRTREGYTYSQHTLTCTK